MYVPFPHVLQQLTANNNNIYEVKMLCNTVYADGRTSCNVYSGNLPLVLESIVDNVRRRNSLVIEFIDDLHWFLHGGFI